MSGAIEQLEHEAVGAGRAPHARLDEHGVAVLEHPGWPGFGDRVRAYGNGIDREASLCI